MAFEQSSLEPALHEITPVTPSSGLVPNPLPSSPFVPTSRHQWDLVFHSVFDEFYSPLASIASSVPVEEAPAPVESTGSPSSTIVDQDAPSPMDTLMVEKSKLDPTHYRGMVGILMYLTSNRPDLVYAIYADHAGCQDTRRSTSGSMQLLGDRLVSWSSKRQKSVVISSLGFNKIPMYYDNKCAITLCCNNVQHSRSNHIDIIYHFIKEQVENGVVELYFVRTEYQLANFFTKALSRERLEFLIDKLGMRSFTPETLKELADEAEE
ncbi:hypothetical protein Tco_0509310 [Tanacetum coccineum]